PNKLRFVHARLSFSFWMCQRLVQALRPAPAGRPRPPGLLLGNGKGLALGFLGGTCDLLGDSCGHPELPRRDADEALEVMGELALVREAGAGGDPRQGQVGSCLQELPGPLDAAQDDHPARPRLSATKLRRPRPKWPRPRRRSRSLPRRRTQNRPTRGKLPASRFPTDRRSACLDCWCGGCP